MVVDKDRMVVFLLNEQRYALSLSTVERVIPAVEITTLPKAPEIVMGVINLQGEIIPMINVRRRFRLPEKEVDPGDHFLIARASNRKVGLIVDMVLDVIEQSTEAITSAKAITPGIEYVEGIMTLQDGLILIHDLAKFLSFPEATQLDEALAATSSDFSGGEP
ncbi:MAG TPA: chemotaxis protein CheW [Acidobacteriota bacterium]|nr:chemotaxis protein CheW [Acidobacteriota bacterium]